MLMVGMCTWTAHWQMPDEQAFKVIILRDQLFRERGLLYNYLASRAKPSITNRPCYYLYPLAVMVTAICLVQDFLHVFCYHNRQPFHREVIGIRTKGIFNFFGNYFKACKHIKDKYHYGY